MPGYTIKNLKEIDDSSGDNAPDVEARFARKHLDSEHLGVSYFRYAPGVPPDGRAQPPRAGRGIRRGRGSGRIKLDDEIRELRQWDVVRISPETVRALEGGPEGLEIIAVGADRPEGGDGVRVEDWWV